MTPSVSFATLPRNIIYTIIKELDRPDKLALGLICPYFLFILADYYDLDRYRSNPEAWARLGLPDGATSWHDSAAQATIIRYLTKAGYSDNETVSVFIDEPDHHDTPDGSDEMEIDSDPAGYVELGDMDMSGLHSGLNAPGLLPSYEDSDEAVDDELVELLLSEWLDKKFDILDGCVVCADCSRFILCSRPDGRPNPFAANMLHRPRWFRHCGDCEKGYGTAPGTVLT
ncbi:uncharacterized protein DSM5745_02670 [Aspergillus mulundensis]|uniref:F-box domain-containing protein n=1 Tax=Aspergillus mulundensis TaxID=1810919 RepID=A0A3D8SX57_9EURO|nr:Uncharacterized protein DSM5745_02670 [Aspergillus mulundensis]RDW90895.1 Uncharacterized protein DSM5745_02670 [Aspergillus mulundensis]